MSFCHDVPLPVTSALGQAGKAHGHHRELRPGDGLKKESNKVAKRNLREGDLVFFTSSRSKNKVANSKAYGDNSKGYGDRIHPYKKA